MTANCLSAVLRMLSVWSFCLQILQNFSKRIKTELQKLGSNGSGQKTVGCSMVSRDRGAGRSGEIVEFGSGVGLEPDLALAGVGAAPGNAGKG